MVTRHRASAPSFEGGRDTRVGKNVSIGGISPLRTHFCQFSDRGNRIMVPPIGNLSCIRRAIWMGEDILGLETQVTRMTMPSRDAATPPADVLVS